MDEVLCRTADGVMTMTLNRPAKKNALTRAMYDSMTAALRRAQTDEEVRVVVIAAEGADFCAGNDILDFVQDLPKMQTEDFTPDDMPVFRFLKVLTFFSKPLVAAVQGQAVGIGVTMLLHCDLVAVGEDVRLTLPFLKLGLVPEAGSTLLLPERIGHARAFAWMALGEAVGAAQAQALGLANEVAVAPLAAAMETAGKLARLSPSSLRHTKAFMRDPERLWQVIRAEGAVFRQQLLSPEAQAALTAFLAR